MKKFKKGMRVGQVISGFGGDIVCMDKWIAGFYKGYAVIADEGEELDQGTEDLNSYDADSGLAKENNIPGFKSYLLTEEETNAGLQNGELTLDGE